jgi:hypothetical protein
MLRRNHLSRLRRTHRNIPTDTEVLTAKPPAGGLRTNWRSVMRIVENLLQVVLFGAVGVVMMYALLSLR